MCVDFPKELDTPECHEAWDLWLEHKRVIKKSYKNPKSEELMLKRLAKLGPGAFVAAIEYSIAQGWQGVYPDPDFAPRSKLIAQVVELRRRFAHD